MGCINSTNINKTFIIEPLSLSGGAPTLSGCTGVYTNNLISCSGDTSISLGSGIINVNGPLSADSVNANFYLSGGTNLLDIFNDTDSFITGGTYDNSSDEITLSFNNQPPIIITGITDYFITGGTYSDSTIEFYAVASTWS